MIEDGNHFRGEGKMLRKVDCALDAVRNRGVEGGGGRQSRTGNARPPARPSFSAVAHELGVGTPFIRGRRLAKTNAANSLRLTSFGVTSG